MLNLNFTPFPTFTTERLLLRQLTMDDAEAISMLRSDARVNEFINRPPVTSFEEAQRFILKINKGISDNSSLYWAITLKNTNALIGTMCLWNFSSEKEIAEIGYELHPDYQGKGMIQEAITNVIDYGFGEIKLKTITALTKEANVKSVSVLLRNNFRLDADYELVKKSNADGLIVYYLSNERRNDA